MRRRYSPLDCALTEVGGGGELLVMRGDLRFGVNERWTADGVELVATGSFAVARDVPQKTGGDFVTEERLRGKAGKPRATLASRMIESLTKKVGALS